MIKFPFAILAATIFSGMLVASGQAAGNAQDPSPCPSGTLVSINSDCLPYGSYDVLLRMLEAGKYFFADPLPASSPDPNLTQLPFYYAKVNTGNAPLFASPQDAADGKVSIGSIAIVQNGLAYVTYSDVQEFNGKNYYMTEFGKWMRRADITPNQTYSPFMGLQFSATPSRQFGWILDAQVIGPVQPRLAPGQSAQLSDVIYNQYDVVQVYETRDVDGVQWMEVGPDLWFESRQLRLVTPNTTPPDGVTNGRWIEINLEQQTLSVYQDSRLVYATLVATGLPGVWTRPGLFQIYERHESTLMKGAFEADKSDFYYLEDVPWTMYFDEARALHGAYWRARFGFEQSHGCVNLSVGDSHWLFNWAADGDWVWVHDPSGRTPEDPSLYGTGGA